ncbi:hypothetical protein K474DRAFT_75176 [Panus rudis PR-1116 ss-1]|nr:hypothetical protein K474DRAFT_75176 [Panus rudis PR-1116 ss-1]
MLGHRLSNGSESSQVFVCALKLLTPYKVLLKPLGRSMMWQRGPKRPSSWRKMLPNLQYVHSHLAQYENLPDMTNPARCVSREPIEKPECTFRPSDSVGVISILTHVDDFILTGAKSLTGKVFNKIYTVSASCVLLGTSRNSNRGFSACLSCGHQLLSALPFDVPLRCRFRSGEETAKEKEVRGRANWLCRVPIVEVQGIDVTRFNPHRRDFFGALSQPAMVAYTVELEQLGIGWLVYLVQRFIEHCYIQHSMKPQCYVNLNSDLPNSSINWTLVSTGRR